MATVSVSIDVPDVERGVRFYRDAFGFAMRSRPAPGVAVLRAGATTVCLLEKAAGSAPVAAVAQTRSYERHWTPLHLDIHVDDLETAIANAVAAGALVEQTIADEEHGTVVFCADPFGHGFCLIEQIE